ncbi:Ankyrin repeats (3 copies) [Carpediemonas membranifera]|uniref:Ankyrin repeats (3 copies) n=1 Tax=Carpediemonas membranifera TaxID=201153 RepID=A0A8J6E273_9EUKA|nr:Ankyrin repeats (3 copies) [Carpediemonas membranifera]|eukprot:KAG9397269.1 Ankyrin repeats (3 copies) [Carpediemonas membranifera]
MCSLVQNRTVLNEDRMIGSDANDIDEGADDPFAPSSEEKNAEQNEELQNDQGFPPILLANNPCSAGDANHPAGDNAEQNTPENERVRVENIPASPAGPRNQRNTIPVVVPTHRNANPIEIEAGNDPDEETVFQPVVLYNSNVLDLPHPAQDPDLQAIIAQNAHIAAPPAENQHDHDAKVAEQREEPHRDAPVGVGELLKEKEALVEECAFQQSRLETSLCIERAVCRSEERPGHDIRALPEFINFRVLSGCNIRTSGKHAPANDKNSAKIKELQRQNAALKAELSRLQHCAGVSENKVRAALGREKLDVPAEPQPAADNQDDLEVMSDDPVWNSRRYSAIRGNKHRRGAIAAYDTVLALLGGVGKADAVPPAPARSEVPSPPPVSPQKGAMSDAERQRKKRAREKAAKADTKQFEAQNEVLDEILNNRKAMLAAALRNRIVGLIDVPLLVQPPNGQDDGPNANEFPALPRLDAIPSIRQMDASALESKHSTDDYAPFPDFDKGAGGGTCDADVDDEDPETDDEHQVLAGLAGMRIGGDTGPMVTTAAASRAGRPKAHVKPQLQALLDTKNYVESITFANANGALTGHADVIQERRDELRMAIALAKSCLEGDLAVVQTLIDAGVNLEIRDDDGDTPLLIATMKGHVGIVRALVKAKADCSVVRANGASPLLIAAMYGNVDLTRLLINANKSMVDVPDGNDVSPLTLAATFGHNKCVGLLVEGGADVNGKRRSSDAWTPLIAAALKDHAEIVKLLVRAKADLSLADEAGQTALMAACINGHLDSIKALVEAGADISAVDNNDDPVLILAVQRKQSAVVSYLLEEGCSPNACRADGCTALYIAAQSGCSEIVKLLLDRGADTTIPDADGKLPSEIAKANGHKKCAALLDRTRQTERAETSLVAAAADGNQAIVRDLLGSGADPNRPNDQGRTPLIAAAIGSHSDVVELLLSRGATIDLGGSDGRTSLMEACLHGRTSVVEVLIERGADRELADPSGSTALHHAVEGGHACVGVMLRAGCNVNARKTNGCTALYLAAKEGRNEILKMLVDAGADPTMKGKTGWLHKARTPREIARAKGHKDCVDQLDHPEHGAENPATQAPEADAGDVQAELEAMQLSDDSEPDAEGQPVMPEAGSVGSAFPDDPPLLAAVADPGKVDAVLKGKVDVNVISRGTTALVAAIQGGHWDSARRLLSHGADPLLPADGVNAMQVPPDTLPADVLDGIKTALTRHLCRAAAQSDDKEVKRLLTLGAKPSGVGDAVPLCEAVKANSFAVVRTLVKHGADAAAVEKDKVAKKMLRKNEDLANLLRKGV